MFAVVDLETTGGNPGTDKIIEIAIFIHDGVQIRKEFSSLVNPEVPIPSFISRLTGITDAMVSGAPFFSDIAGDVANLLGENIFVAHNVQFDYNFLSHALSREGHLYENRMLCTCKTSRILLPGFPSYSLSKLCGSLAIELNGAHRAAADAKATAKVLDLLITRSGGILESYFSRKEKRENRSKIPDEQLELLPGKTGGLLFYDENRNVVFITKAGNVRKKAWWIMKRLHTRRFAGLSELAVSVDYIATGSDLLAAIRETELILQLNPCFNRRLNSRDSRVSLYEKINSHGYLVIEKGPYCPEVASAATYAGEAEASKRLKRTYEEFGLRPESELNPVAGNSVNELPEIYNRRASMAVESLQGSMKNYIITGRGPKADTCSMIVIKRGTYAGYLFADSNESYLQVEDLLSVMQQGTDHPVIFKTILNHVSQGKYQQIINF